MFKNSDGTYKPYIKNFLGTPNNLVNRQLWVKKTLLNVPKGNRILDAGAGEQQYKQYCSHLNYVSQDFNEYDGVGDNEGLQTGKWDVSKTDIISDIVEIPEKDASFDTIICTEVFEHIPDPIAALDELYRLLRPGGELILTAPFASLTHFAPFHYCTGFSKYWYEYHLPKTGFTITEITPNGDYSAIVAQELVRMTTYYGKAPFFIKVFTAFILRYIKSRKDQKSNAALGPFGYHVIAQKK